MYNHNKAQQSKTVCIFIGIYCITINEGEMGKLITSSIVYCKIIERIDLIVDTIGRKYGWPYYLIFKHSALKKTKNVIKEFLPFCLGASGLDNRGKFLYEILVSHRLTWKSRLGVLLLTSPHSYVITYSVNCWINYLSPPQTSTVQTLKFRKGYIISSHML